MEQAYVRSKIVERFVQRYIDANRVIRYGNWVKIGAVAVGGLGILLWLFAECFVTVPFAFGTTIQRSGPLVPAPFNVFLSFASIMSVIPQVVALFGFGVLICAYGQTLRASLDTAVDVSPFLTNEDRQEIMLGFEGAAPVVPPSAPPKQSGPVSFHDAINPPSA